MKPIGTQASTDPYRDLFLKGLGREVSSGKHAELRVVEKALHVVHDGPLGGLTKAWESFTKGVASLFGDDGQKQKIALQRQAAWQAFSQSFEDSSIVEAVRVQQAGRTEIKLNARHVRQAIQQIDQNRKNPLQTHDDVKRAMKGLKKPAPPPAQSETEAKTAAAQTPLKSEAAIAPTRPSYGRRKPEAEHQPSAVDDKPVDQAAPDDSARAGQKVAARAQVNYATPTQMIDQIGKIANHDVVFALIASLREQGADFEGGGDILLSLQALLTKPVISNTVLLDHLEKVENLLVSNKGMRFAPDGALFRYEFSTSPFGRSMQTILGAAYSPGDIIHGRDAGEKANLPVKPLSDSAVWQTIFRASNSHLEIYSKKELATQLALKSEQQLIDMVNKNPAIGNRFFHLSNGI